MEQVTLSNCAIVIYFTHFPEATNNANLKLYWEQDFSPEFLYVGILLCDKVCQKGVQVLWRLPPTLRPYFVTPLSPYTPSSCQAAGCQLFS